MFGIGQKKSIEQLRQEIREAEEERRILLEGGKFHPVPGAGGIRIRDADNVRAVTANWNKLNKLKKQLREQTGDEGNKDDSGSADEPLTDCQTESGDASGLEQRLAAISQELKSIGYQRSVLLQAGLGSLLADLSLEDWSRAITYAAARQHAAFWGRTECDVLSVGYATDFYFNIKPYDIILSHSSDGSADYVKNQVSIGDFLLVMTFAQEQSAEVKIIKVIRISEDGEEVDCGETGGTVYTLSRYRVIAKIKGISAFGSNTWLDLNTMPRSTLIQNLKQLLDYANELQSKNEYDYSNQIHELQLRLQILEQLG